MTLLAASTALLLAVALSLAAPAAADTTVRVNTTVDETQTGNGTCSLREATLYANHTDEPDCALTPASGTTTINLPAGTFGLTGLPLTVTGNASISGAGAATTTITAGGRSQVLLVMPGATVSVSGVTVTGGQSPSACTGPLCVGARLPSFGFPGGGIANDGTLTLTGVTVSGNRTGAGAVNDACNPPGPAPCNGGDGGDGGGISNSKTGTLTIAGSTIIGNSTGTGAAGQAGPPNESPGGSGNAGNGGGISNAGTLTIKNSTIADNTTAAGPDGTPGAVSSNGRGGNASVPGAGGSGGGIESSGPLFISGSTLVGNRTGAGGHGGTGGAGTGQDGGGNGTQGGTGGSGGAIDSNTDMTLTNSTIVANAAAGGGAGGVNGTTDGAPSNAPPPGPGTPGTGGGINERAMGSTLTHVTITANSAAGVGGGVDGAGGTVTVGNSIIAGNVAAAPSLNCSGVLVDQGGNIEFAASSCPAGFLRGDPRLATLASYGGPTQTIALQPGSVAIHHVRTCVLGSDQRGAARPVGLACDSGAYEVAPPSLGGVSASGVTTASATIGAAVNPNLQGTTVVVNYGTTPSYGSSTPPQGLGAGNAAAPFAAALTGLQPGTTYHFDVVASNADGTTTSSDGVFTTLPPLTASIAGATTTGPTLSLTIACAGGFGPGTCAGNIRVASRPAAKHAHTSRVKRKHPPRTSAFTVAAGAYSVNSGGHVTVKLRLNRKGRAMLTQHYVLATTLSLGGTSPVTQNVTFRYPRITSAGTPISFSFRLRTDGTGTLTELTVTKIPRGGKATVICRGGGCPYPQRTFVPRHGQLVLAPSFEHSTLRLGATVTLEVTAANRVGEVKVFTIGSAEQLIVSSECLPPGVTHATRCVTN